MKHLFLWLSLAATTCGTTAAQTDSADVVMAFTITDYTKPLNDTVTVVQVNIPPVWPVQIRDKQVGIIKAIWTDKAIYDTSVKASGRCQLIKGNYYYFSMKHSIGKTMQPGDLLYTRCRVPVMHNGLLFSIGRYAISLTKVTDEQFYNGVTIFTMTALQEEAHLDSMVADIRYTGKAMMAQSPNDNRLITEGPYKGKYMFTAMMEVTKEELKEFLSYIEARPSKYAGHVWKISEIFATWMSSGAPRVVKK